MAHPGFPHELRPLIPHRLYSPISYIGQLEEGLGVSCFMKTVVLVAAKHIHDGEELFMDYRLNPSAPNLPSWYEPYDVEDAQNRWQQHAGAADSDASSNSNSSSSSSASASANSSASESRSNRGGE